jgi:hypothetical protein
MNYSNNILTSIKDKIPLARSNQNSFDLSTSTLTIPRKTKISRHFGFKSPASMGKIQNLLTNNLLIFNK